MQVLDRQGRVDLVAGAGPLTGVVADPAADCGKRMILLEQFEGLVILARVDQGNVALDAHVCGAGRPARGGAALGDGKGPRDRLGILFVDGLAGGEPLVVLVGKLDGADLGAVTAAGAFGKIHVACLLADFGGEMARIALQAQQFGIGQKLNVEMPADLDQFG